MKKMFAALSAICLASSAHAAATVTDACPAASNGRGLVGNNCNFTFWDAEAPTPQQVLFTASSYHDVISASGNETQVIKGAPLDVKSASDAPVVYSAIAGPPIPAGQICFSFTTGKQTTNWQLVIETDGSWTLTCNFKRGDGCYLTGSYTVSGAPGGGCQPKNTSGLASITQDGTNLAITNECNDSTQGTMTNSMAFSAAAPWNLTAIVSADCNTIAWGNGTFWQRQ